jgi:hypothetical protein
VLIGGAAGFATLKIRKLNGLKRTRKTVQEDLHLMQRGEDGSGAPAIEAR